MGHTLKVDIVADARSYEQALARASNSTTTFGQSFRKVGQAALIAGAAIGGVAIIVGKKSVEAAIQAQEANDKLTVAFKNQGIAMDAASKSVLALEATGRKLGFTNEDTRTGLTKLIQAGKSWAQANTEIKVAQDLSRSSGQSLGDSVTTLIRLQTGSLRVAKQYGIVLPDLTSKQWQAKAAVDGLTVAQEKGQFAYDELTKKVTGQADAFAGSAAGGMAQFHAQLQAIEERIGTALIPILQSLLDWTNAHWPEIAAVAGAALSAIGAAFHTLAAAVGPVVEFFKQHEQVAIALGIALAALVVAFETYNGVVRAAALVQAAYSGAVAIASATMAAFRTATVEATVAQDGLNVAMRANPFGLVAAGAAAIATAVILLSARLGENKGEFNAAKEAATGYKNALDQLRTATDNLRGAHLQVQQAELNLLQARKNLEAVTKTASTGSLAYREASLGVKQAQFELDQATKNVKDSEVKNTAAKAEASAATAALKGKIADLTTEYQNLITHQGNVIKNYFQYGHASTDAGAASSLFAGKLAEISKEAGGNATELGRATSAANFFTQALNAIPRSITVDIVTNYTTTGTPPPHRAAGGPVTGGSPYVVGERGPEIFVPSSSGRIVPNRLAARAAGRVIELHVHAGTVIGGTMEQVARDLVKPLATELHRYGLANVTTGLT